MEFKFYESTLRTGYKENILEYMQTIDNKSSIIDGEEILYCLNTDETKSFLDDYVARRINFTLED